MPEFAPVTRAFWPSRTFGIAREGVFEASDVGADEADMAFPLEPASRPHPQLRAQLAGESGGQDRLSRGPNTADASGGQSGHASAAPPSAASNSRRPVVAVIPPPARGGVKATIPCHARVV